jgi:hypothetical protein
MAETHPFRLHPDEVARRAREFFTGQLGIPLVRDMADFMRFEDPHGFMEIDIRGDANNQSRVTFQCQGYEREVHEFRRLLAEQAEEETRQGA